MKFRCCILVFVAAMALGCQGPLSAVCPHSSEAVALRRLAHQDQCPTVDTVPVDDPSQLKKMERLAVALSKAGKCTPAADLIKQLARKQCKLSPAKPRVATMTPQQIYARCAPSVLVVGGVYKCKKCGRLHVSPASGFLVSTTGAFVTNYHVVNNKERTGFVAMTHDGKAFGVKEVLAADKPNDVAICQLNAAGATFRAIPLSGSAPVGTAVSVISHPNKRLYCLTRGIVSRYFKHPKGRSRVTMMSITADYARGSSGAPVLNDAGAVVGVVSSTNSVYYTVEKGKKSNLQMVFKDCAPAGAILKLIRQ